MTHIGPLSAVLFGQPTQVMKCALEMRVARLAYRRPAEKRPFESFASTFQYERKE
jgi:hypothetical protein